jgi:CHASE1-domain containing sensor protein
VQVNADGAVIQELQVSPMGVIELIYPLNNMTRGGLGLDIFAQVSREILAAAAAAATAAAMITGLVLLGVPRLAVQQQQQQQQPQQRQQQQQGH